MNSIKKVDAHLHCACCKKITGADIHLLKISHGTVDYIEHLDMNVFDEDSEPWHICEVCTDQSWRDLVNYEEELEEIDLRDDVRLFEIEGESYILEAIIDYHVDEVPYTWFDSTEPDQCACCRESLDIGDPIAQFSVVKRHGRRFSPPILFNRTVNSSRFCWFCLSCVSDFYSSVR